MNFISFDEGNQAVFKEPSRKCKKRTNLKNGFTKKGFGQKGGGVIYLGHIPHGFYEDEMKSYFNQFGKVIATTVSRSKKTGRSRGYGFVQFQDEEVAKIAAEAMNNYLMYNRIIKCRYIPPEERKKKIYESKISGTNYPRQINRKIELRNKMKALSKLTQTTYLQKVQEKVDAFKTFFEKNGIDFTFKINDESSQDNSTDNENEKNKTKTSNLKEKSENEMENIDGVLEIDESDNEIFFKTPPQVKKVFKKSLNSPAVHEEVFIPSNNSLVKKIANNNNNSNSEKKQKEKKSKNKRKISLPKQNDKNKGTGENSEKITKKEKILENFLTSKSGKNLPKKKGRQSFKKNSERKIKNY